MLPNVLFMYSRDKKVSLFNFHSFSRISSFSSLNDNIFKH